MQSVLQEREVLARFVMRILGSSLLARPGKASIWGKGSGKIVVGMGGMKEGVDFEGVLGLDIAEIGSEVRTISPFPRFSVISAGFNGTSAVQTRFSCLFPACNGEISFLCVF